MKTCSDGAPSSEKKASRWIDDNTGHSREVPGIVQNPTLAQYLGDQGTDPDLNSPSQYAQPIRDEASQRGRVVKSTGAHID